jgi:hypothetical protein
MFRSTLRCVFCLLSWCSSHVAPPRVDLECYFSHDAGHHREGGERGSPLAAPHGDPPLQFPRALDRRALPGGPARAHRGRRGDERGADGGGNDSGAGGR